jgi:uroporphyrin-3 C-methyltransferase
LQVNTETTENENDSPESSPESKPERPPKPAKSAGPAASKPEETKPEESKPRESKSEESKPADKKSADSSGQPPRKGGILALLAFIFAAAALAGTGWMWWQDQAVVDQQEQRVITELSRLENADSELALKLTQVRDEVSSLAAGDIGAEFSALQSRLEADRRKLESAETAISEQMELARSMQAEASQIRGRLGAAEAALAGLTTRELDAKSELDLAEVDYLLRLANERLKLFADPVAADQALDVADMHLAALDNPMYLTVRQDIAAARRSMAAIDIPDYLQIANDLDAIQERLVSLPFHGEEPPVNATEPVEDEGWWARLKGVFSGLVTVRRSTEEENQRISLEDKDYIRQRIWLQLEIAHLSLMRRDQDGFRKSLARVEGSLADWFDMEDANYQAVIQGLENLKAQQIQVDIPDISAPWSTLRMLRAGQARPTAAPQPVREVPTTETEEQQSEQEDQQ